MALSSHRCQSSRSHSILKDVKDDIDRFLDPSLLSLSESPESPAAPETVKIVRDEKAPLELLKLSCAKEALNAELEASQQECLAVKARREREAGKDAASISRLSQERDDLRAETRAKKRRLSEMEDEILQLRVERDSLLRTLDELSDKSKLEIEAAQEESMQARRSLESELAELRSQPVQSQPPPVVDSEAFKTRIAELESEVSSLRVALEQSAPDRQLAEQLHRRHRDYEKELQASREALDELKSVKGLNVKLEHEVHSLKAALSIRDKALREAEEASQSVTAARRELAAFGKAAAEVISAAQEGKDSTHGVDPTPMELGLAWSRLQAEIRSHRLRAAESEKKVEDASVSERQVQAEARKVKVDLSSMEAQLQEVKLDLRKARDEAAALRARESVLREALAGRGDAKLAALPEAISASGTKELEDLLESKRQALADSAREADALRKELSSFSDADVRARRLERVNQDLWQDNKELEAKVSQLERQQELIVEDTDYDRRTTKILHLARGPGGQPLRATPDDQRLGGDLEQEQAKRQLERFKKATKKYVQEFREGIYSLLGWKVEMKGEGSRLRWHLTSRYQEGQELVFQLQAATAGQPAEFELMGTSWALQLQGDRQAMAYLTIYHSIPGFLAYVTSDLLTQQTLTT